MKKLLSLSVLVLVGLTSCNNDDYFQETNITGFVFEDNAPVLTPVPNALVELVWVEHFTINTRYRHIDTVRTNASGYYSITAKTPNEDLMVWVPEAKTYFPTLDKDSHHRNVKFGSSNQRNLYITPISWVRINYDQLDPTHGVYINPIAGGRIDGFSLISDTSVISQIWGNSAVDLSTFYNISGQQIEQKYITVNSGSSDTTEVNISF